MPDVSACATVIEVNKLTHSANWKKWYGWAPSKFLRYLYVYLMFHSTCTLAFESNKCSAYDFMLKLYTMLLTVKGCPIKLRFVSGRQLSQRQLFNLMRLI